MDDRKELLDAIRPVIDPEIGYSIVEMGMIYTSYIENDIACVLMALTTPACPYAPELIEDVKSKLSEAGYKNSKIQIAVKPKWTPEMMSDEIKLDIGLPI